MWVLIGFLIVLCAVFLILYRMMRINEVEQENHLMQVYMMSMQEFYGAIQSRIEATRCYRHDLAKHIQTLENLLKKQGQSEGIQEYMEDLKDRYQELRREEVCSDEIINSILSLKKQQCEEKEIPITIQMEDCSYWELQDMDKVSLIHNLLDNAVEANERIGKENKKGIDFAMGKSGAEIWIFIKNYICPGEKVNFQSQKDRKEEHGIGTKVISNVIQKYNGRIEMEMDQGNNLFTQKIYLTLKGTE